MPPPDARRVPWAGGVVLSARCCVLFVLLSLVLLAGPVAGPSWTAEARAEEGDDLSVPGWVFPSVHPLDGRAAARRAEAEDAVARAVEALGDRFGWWPEVDVPIYLVSTDQGMVDALQAFSGMPAAQAESFRSFYGASTHVRSDGSPGSAVFVNTSRLVRQGQLPHALAHELVHVMQWDWMRSAAGHLSVPYWLIEGMAELYATRIAGTSVDSNYRQAVEDARAGSSPPLEELSTWSQWVRHTRTLADQMGAYGKAYATVRELDGLGPPDLLVTLFRRDSGSLADFRVDLEKTFGISVEDLEALVVSDLSG